MNRYFGFSLSLCAALAFWACSQTVSSPDKDSRSDDDLSNVPGFHPTGDNEFVKGSSANMNLGSSSSRGGGLSSSSEIYPDGVDIDLSNLDVTQYIPDGKLDCKFTVDDDKWEVEYQQADTSMSAVVEFKSDGYMWVDMDMTQKVGSEDECEQSAALLSVFGLMAATEPDVPFVMSGSCDGAVLTSKVKGRFEEYTQEDKQKMYANLCN